MKELLEVITKYGFEVSIKSVGSVIRFDLDKPATDSIAYHIGFNFDPEKVNPMDLYDLYLRPALVTFESHTKVG